MTTISNIQNHNPCFSQHHHLVKERKIEGRLGINQSICLISNPGPFCSLSSKPSFKHSLLKEPLKLVPFRCASIFPHNSYWSHSGREEISSMSSNKGVIIRRALDPFGPGVVYDLNDENSTWTQRAWLASSCATLLITLTKCISLTLNNHGPWLQLPFVVFIGYLLADLTSGIFHWIIDNYGSPQTPVFGNIIKEFNGHHQNPPAFAKQHIARNLDILSTGVTLIVMPINVLSVDPGVLGFMFAYAGCVMCSQLFHTWAHTSKGKLPAAILALQNAGLVLPRSPHAAHHRPPHNNNYCMVSGILNRFLDRSKFFLGLEVVIFNVLRIKPRSWTDFPSSD